MQRYIRKDPIVREAIWKHYACKCFYCNQPLQMDVMTVDHILPQSCHKDSDTWKKILSKFNLNQDFKIDSLENYICACGYCNKKKADNIFPRQIELALFQAKKLAPKIKKEIARTRRSLDFDKDRSKVKSYIGEDRDKAEEVYNFITDENDNFVEGREISDFAGTANYHYARKKIMLNAYLPKYRNEGKGSCLLIFKTLRMRDCLITLDHKEILQSFCQGIRTPLSENLRSFVVCQDLHDSSTYYIQLGNIRFPLEADQLEILLEVIDDLSGEYLKYLTVLEDCLGTHQFQPKGYGNVFKLIKLKRWIWRDIIKFARIFNYEAGNSKWHIFDSPGDILNVYTSCSTDRLNSGHHVTLYPEVINDSYLDYSNDIWITWHPLSQIYDSDQDFPAFNLRDEWDVCSTYTWLTKELIPYVEFYFSIRESGHLNFLKRILINLLNIEDYFYKKFLNNFCLNQIGIYDGSAKYQYINIAKISNTEDLLKAAYKLQEFFSMKHKVLFLQEDFKSLLVSLQNCIYYSSSNDWRYMREKLSFVHGESREEVLSHIDDFVTSMIEKKDYSYLLDDIFRVYISALEENRLNRAEVKKILDSWLPFISLYLDDLFIKKHTENLY